LLGTPAPQASQPVAPVAHVAQVAQVAHAVQAARPSAKIVELEQKIVGSNDREEITTAALDLALVYARCAALFVVRQGIVQGIRGLGETLADRPLEGILMPMTCESIITTPASSGEPYRGGPPEGDHNVRLLRALGRQDVRDLAVLPVKIRGRVVNLLYVDNGADPLGATAYAALRATAECIAEAYERLILERKKLSG
jgi:hypothetical protein